MFSNLFSMPAMPVSSPLMLAAPIARRSHNSQRASDKALNLVALPPQRVSVIYLPK